MAFLHATELSVPLFQIALLLALSTLAMLFGRIKLALLINYLFTLYWGYIFNRDELLGPNLEKIDHFTAIYFGFGFIIVILASIGFLVHRD
ncbi:MAG: hypothetical protein JRJ42_05170 [Deltaproteobacteria bacterium]|nr:hypothetical protein [Deltaproteobacteria bacterium]MBW2019969.1 hypothetical protein [Deltaproteobacteria bacterium]MBW2074798.1 hypothetical protein [Deltaproteobacteria bacterium]RLB82894.1 MAG: hypothetical protein DRH17_04400 [Deltaproteobacteria bacterium]